MSSVDPPPETTRVPVVRWVAALVIMALAAAALVVAGARHQETPMAAAEMMDVSPGGTIDLAALAPQTRDLYHAVAADQHAMESVRCYCGCEALLAHEDLYECFVRPDGMWERHAVGCAVCQDEARQVVAARAEGTPLDQIVVDIDTRFGQITAP